jgi:hypothetical protein
MLQVAGPVLNVAELGTDCFYVRGPDPIFGLSVYVLGVGGADLAPDPGIQGYQGIVQHHQRPAVPFILSGRLALCLPQEAVRVPE